MNQKCHENSRGERHAQPKSEINQENVRLKIREVMSTWPVLHDFARKKIKS